MDLGEEDNNKRLISVSELINNNRDLTTNQALNLGIIVLFAPRYKAPEITEKVAKLYLELENLDKKLDFVLYSVIYAMIDAYSITEKDFQRLIAMISKKTADDIKEKFESYRYAMNSLEIAKDSLESVNSSLETVNNNLKTTKNELKTANNNLKTTKNELSETKTKLLDSENANKALKTENLNLETENSNLKNEIFILRQQLANSK